jgi:YidC/Oxa1 family membrane protein insertase
VIPLAILGPLEQLLTNILEWLHSSIGLTWALSIVVLTLMVRMVMVPLTVKQIHSMQRLQVLAPELKALQQKYKNDKKRQQEEVMRFYREYKVNPAASCLPILIQIPVFIALFFVLKDFEKEVFPHYPNSDLGFINIVPNITDPVNSHWSGWVLLVVYVASQTLSALLTPVTDKTQRYIFVALPFVFIPFVLNFPVGLLLYWVTTNLWTVGQGLVTRRLLPKPEPPPKRSSRAAAKEAPPPPSKPAADGKDGESAPAPAPTAAGSGQRRVRRRKKRGPQGRR